SRLRSMSPTAGMNSLPIPSSGRQVRRLAATYLRPHAGPLTLAFFGILSQTLLLLPVPLVQGPALDYLVAGEHREGEIVLGVMAGFGISVGCHLVRGTVGRAAAAMMHRVSLEVVRDLTDAMHRKLQGQPLAYFDRHPTGDLLARLTADVGSLLLF